MRLFGKDTLREFVKENPKAKKSLNAWEQTIEVERFRHFADLKKVIGSADYVKPYTVFNISKNKHRLITQITYSIQTVRVASIMPHKEYDKGKWKKTK